MAIRNLKLELMMKVYINCILFSVMRAEVPTARF